MEDYEDFEEIETLDESGETDMAPSFNDESVSSTMDTSSENLTDNKFDENETDVATKEKLNEKKDNNYQKANSGRQAYQKKLDNGKDYYNNKKNDIKNQQNQLKNAKDENKKKRDSAEDRLQKAKENHSNQRGFSNRRESRKELKEAKKEDKNAKKEHKEQQKKEKGLKKDEKNVKKDAKKADRFKKLHPIEAAKMAISRPLKILKMKIMLIAGSICILIFGAFFIIEQIKGVIDDAFGNIDKGLTGVSNFQEKMDNFYRGFGFSDSEQAFYDELQDLCEKYNDNLDEVLLLSTLFYTESMEGYDTDYSQMETDADPSVESGNNSGIWNTARSYVRGKFEESIHTVSEDGLVYNTGKIYRLRKLARNQFSTGLFGLPKREGELHTDTLGQFLSKYMDYISNDMKRIFGDAVGTTFGYFTAVFKELWALIVGSEYSGYFVEEQIQTVDSLKDGFLDLFGDIFYGFLSITSIDIGKSDDGSWGLTVSYRDYVYDEDNYNSYLKKHYIENMPEFQKILPAKGTEAREKKKEQIIDQIYENKKLFEDIYMQHVSSSSEAYVDSCVGGIDIPLVSELALPVKIPDNTTVNLSDSDYAFGTRDGKNHNGVDLNTATAGVSDGSEVYAIANGEVIESLPDVSCNTRNDTNCEYPQGAWVKIKHEMTVGNKDYTFYSVYMHLQTNSGQPKKGTKVSKGQLIGKIGNTGNSSGSHLHFEFRTEDDVAIDPTNLFIPCSDSTTLVGNTNEEKIWNYLTGKGYPKASAAGIMGNMKTESGFESQIVQGDTPMTQYSIDYTNNVDSGKISKSEFANNGPNGGGYGLVQWTYYTLKEGLYDYAKNEKKSSIGDLSMQLEYLDLHLAKNNSGLYNTLQSSSTSYDTAARRFMLDFENPYDKSESAQSRRSNNAKEIYNKYANQ